MSDDDATIEGDPETETDAGPRRPPRNPGRRRGRPSKARGRPLSSDEAAFRWTVRGVPLPVRTMALKAAEDRGMTVGDWLAEAIVAFSRGGGRGPDEARSNLPATEAPPDLVDMVRNIDRRLAALEQRQSEAEKPQPEPERPERRRRVGVFRRLFSHREPRDG